MVVKKMNEPFTGLLPNHGLQVKFTFASTKASYLCGHAYQCEGWDEKLV